MISNRDLLKNTLSHKESERVPFNFFFTPSSLEKAESHYGSPLDEVLDFPLRVGGLESPKPIFADPTEFGKSARDEFGVLWSTGFNDRGIPYGPCITEMNMKKYIFPDPLAPYRFREIETWLAGKKDCYTFMTIGDLWERATFMRGLEEILLDLHANPSFVHELMESINEYNLTTMKFIHDNFKFDGIVLSDDYGSQKSMLFSPQDWRKFIKPYLSGMVSAAKKYGWIMFLHSCGYIRPVMKDLTEIGIDILHPVQPETMDIFELKKEFGKDLTFCGGVSTQRLLPFGRPEEIRAEVRLLKDLMGKNGGYILDTGIQIIADVPLKNIVALIDEAKA